MIRCQQSSSCNLRKIFFKIYILVLLPILFTSVSAQELQLSSLKSPINKYFDVADPATELTRNIEFHSSIGDTILAPPTIKPKLLPANMSLMERAMWGESGILRSIGITGELSPETRKNELQARRVMLTAHQIGGFITLGLMLATCYYGQRVIDGERNLDQTKKSLAGYTIMSYSLTGLLSILSPPPLIRRDDEISTTTLHKALAWVHVAGMIATPILATYIGRQFNTDAAHVHQISGYLTTAVFALSMVVVTF
jgi:hypothetical protein